MTRDELRHLEHANLALAVEDRPHGGVRVDLRPFLFVLQAVLLDVVPELLESLRRGSGFEPTMAASLSSGCTGFIKAAFGLRFEGVLAVVLGIEAD